MSIDWWTLGTGTLIGLIPSLFVAIAAHSTYDRMRFRKKKRNNQIEIISPRQDEIIIDSRQFQPGLCYRISGKLGFLPADHQIWLLVEESKTKKIWPQGFTASTYRSDIEQWEGFIFAPGSKEQITVVAVVAPPSSQMMFNYYQLHGVETNWAPLASIPEECKNIAVIRTRLP